MCADALDFLNNLSEESADVVFLDPPFNLGKQYGRSGRKRDMVEENDYRNFMRRVLVRSVQVLKPGGALFLYHIPRWALELSQVLSTELEFRHWIAVSMKNGFPGQNHLYPAHYALLYFTKGPPAHFTRPKLPLKRCPHCDEILRDYGGYLKFVEDGINLSDVWDDLSPVRHRKHKHRQSNELPLEIPLRALRMSGHPRGVLIDPFAGSGTSLVAARKCRMRFAACDKEKTYCNLMVKRLEKLDARKRRQHANE